MNNAQTSAELIPFKYEDQPLRVITDETGEHWFVAGDVAKILGYSSTAAMTRSKIDSDDKGVHNLQTLGGTQNVVIISEPGLYAAILGSRVPEAKPFKRWVTHEVLPTIRKTGGYGVAQQPKELSRKELAQMVLEAEEAREAAELELSETRPKALALDSFIVEDGEFTVGQAAKVLNGSGIKMGRNRLFEVLDDIGWIFPEGRRWIPYQRQVKAGTLSVHLEDRWDDEIGEYVPGSAQIYITNRGLYQLRKHLLTLAA